MQRAEQLLAGQGGANRHRRGFRVADFPDHQRIRVLPQNRAQSGGERQADFRINFDLRDAGQLIFNRIFNRNQAFGQNIDFVQCGVQRRGFAAADRPGHENHAVGHGDELLD